MSASKYCQVVTVKTSFCDKPWFMFYCGNCGGTVSYYRNHQAECENCSVIPIFNNQSTLVLDGNPDPLFNKPRYLILNFETCKTVEKKSNKTI